MYDVPTARTTAVVPPTPCDTRSVVRLSPDGRLLAIAYGQGDHLMIDVIDVASADAWPPGGGRRRRPPRRHRLALRHGAATGLVSDTGLRKGAVFEDVLRISVATIQ